MKNTGTELGKRVRVRRIELNLTQAALGELTDLTPSAVSYIETGRSLPKQQTLERVASALECSLDFLLCLVNTPAEQAACRPKARPLTTTERLDAMLVDVSRTFSEPDKRQLLRFYEFLKSESARTHSVIEGLFMDSDSEEADDDTEDAAAGA